MSDAKQPENEKDAEKPTFIELPGMAIGMTVRVQCMGIGASKSYLIGLDPGNYLIIQIPPIPDIATKRHQKNHVTISYLHHGRIYAFRCTLLLLVKEPFRFAALSYPETLENINLRKHERISCLIDADVSVHNRSYEGLVSDISSGGCSFEFNRTDQRDFPSLKVQEKMIICLHLKQKAESIVFNSAIRQIRVDKESLMCGLQFIPSDFREADDEAEKKLLAYLSELQRDA